MKAKVYSLGLVCVGFVGGALYVISCAGNAATDVSGKLQRVQAAGTTVTCPEGSYVVGGGCANTGGCNAPTIKESYPASTTSWFCSMRCDDGSGSIAEASFAICASATPAEALTAE